VVKTASRGIGRADMTAEDVIAYCKGDH
jgi:hypothetical protein